MFTQCPDCKTIFELGIEDLKAAEGHVCCGECDKVFNALASLTDMPPGAREELQSLADAAASVDDDVQGDEMSGDLFEDFAEDGDSENARWTPDAEGIAEGEIHSLEQERWEQKLAELGLDQSEGGAHGNPDAEPDSLSEALPDRDTPGKDAGEFASEDAEAGTSASVSTETGAANNLPNDLPNNLPNDLPNNLANDADWLLAEPEPRADWHWVVAAVVAGVALFAQSIHFWRVDLADVPAVGQWLRPFYSSLGAPLPENWDVSAYSVAKDTISDYPEVAGALLVNATLANNAERAQPYPLLKITLLDRWGEPIGERFFAPAEYLPDSGVAARPIEPGQVSQASVLIMDPGAGAVSYGIDACLRDRDNRLLCAHGRDY